MAPQQSLAQAIRTKYPGEYDDLPDAELEAKAAAKGITLDSLAAGAARNAGGATQAGYEAVKAYQGGGLRGLLNKTAESLPTIGGAAYSLAAGGKGTLTGAGMAALGGATGEAAHQLVGAATGQPVTTDWWDAIKRMGGEAGKQAALEGVGRTVMGTGRFLMRESPNITATDVKSYGDIAGTMARERIPVGPGLAPDMELANPGVTRTRFGPLIRGSATAERRLGEATSNVNSLLAAHQQPTITGAPAVQAVDEILKDTGRGMAGRETTATLSELFRLKNDLAKEVRQGLTPQRAHELKQNFDRLAVSLHEKEAKGGLETVKDAPALRFYQAAADGLRAELRAQVPGYQAGEARLRSLMGAEKVVRNTEAGRYARQGQFGLARNPVVNAFLQGVSDPAFWTRAALTLSHPFVGQSPRLLWGLMEAQRERK